MYVIHVALSVWVHTCMSILNLLYMVGEVLTGEKLWVVHLSCIHMHTHTQTSQGVSLQIGFSPLG